MISRRNYLSIMIMIAVVFLIFMFSVIIKGEGSFYNINEFAREDLPSGNGRWMASGEEELVLYFGEQNTALESMVRQWCVYTKRELKGFEQLQDYLETAGEERSPAVIVLDGAGLTYDEEGKELLSLTEYGVPLIFGSLPEAAQLANSGWLKELLGIDRVVAEETRLLGVQLYDGFFLGGGAEYKAVKEEDKERQDFNLTVPWYTTKSGTKTYLAGLMDKEAVAEQVAVDPESEIITGYFPCLIWRNSYENVPVFAVCGEYMSSMAGLGILNGFLYEAREYELYPVVNAQNMLIHNFPNFSRENEAVLQRLYSRTPQMYFQGVIWPGISAMAKVNELKLTCLLKPQYDYTDGKVPEQETVSFYMQQLWELNSEAGMALSYHENSTFETMLEQDATFYELLKSDYQYQAAYVEENDMESFGNWLGEDGLLQQLVTIGTPYQKGEVLLSYLTDEITKQSITADAKQHTYQDDFMVRGVQTALLYSNVLLDLQEAIWPEEEEDQWQLFFEKIASNVRTYWSGYRGYEQTTLSESDYRVRILLNLDYSQKREENTIYLQVEQPGEQAWFLLRTHEEKVTAVRGGEFQKLEANAYLIQAQETGVEIVLEPVSLKEQRK